MKALADHLIKTARQQQADQLLRAHVNAILDKVGGLQMRWELHRDAHAAITASLKAYAEQHHAMVNAWEPLGEPTEAGAGA